MSATYEIACVDCKEALWIGQAKFIYHGEQHTMLALQVFLFAHERHELIFASSDELDDYQEVDA